MIKPFWGRRWLILTTALTVSLGIFCWLQTLPYFYESSLVLAATSKDGQTIPPGQVPRLYRVMKSTHVFQEVIRSGVFKEQREYGATTEALVERLSRNTGLREDRQGSSVIIELIYLDLTPEAAQNGANVLGQEIATAELKSESESGFAFKVVQPAGPATGPLKPRRFTLTMLALGGGFLLGLVFAVISELFKFGRQIRFASPSA